MKLATFFLGALPLLAIDGTVINRSTTKPGAEIPIVLMRLGDGGMMPVGTVKSGADGKFHFEQPVDGPLLMQAMYNGVTYNKLIKPGDPGNNVELDIFDTGRQASDAKIAQHMMLVEPNDGKLTINESVIYRNSSNKTYADPVNGTFRFYVPPEAKNSLQVRATGPGNVPVKTDAAPAGPANVFKLDFPIKPGESRFDFTYSVPLTNPGKIAGRVLHPMNDKDGQLRLVTPSGVTLSGAGLEDLGTEPQTQAQIYGLAKADYELTVTGTGSLHALEADEASMPEPQAIPPKINDRMWWIVGLSLFALALGFVTLLRKPSIKA